MESVAQITPFEKMLPWNQSSSTLRRRKLQKKKPSRRSERKFNTLSRLAHDTHQRLIDKDSPLRLCIYGDEEDLFMDVFIVDKTKKINHNFTRHIRNDSLENLIKRFHNQIGLVIDYNI